MPMIDEEEKCLIWLSACAGLDNRARVALLRAAKSPKNLFTAFETFRSLLIKEENGFSDSTLSRREREAEAFISRMEEGGQFAVTILSDDYPESLKTVPDPPLVLFGAGRRELLQKRKFCIVGSRITPPYAEKQGKNFAADIARKFAVVTGLAEGGDSAAIAGALESGNLICVLPTGLDECYPAAHASLKEEVRGKGLLLSEYPPEEKVKKYSFHERNRILAGLSEGVLVLSAGMRSGALITANRAADYGKDVFAFPYNIGVAQGAGCNELIKKGACLCTRSADILEYYGFTVEEKNEASLSREEERVLNVLRESGELHTAVIAERAEIKAYEAAATLSSLEIKGLVAKAGGNRYTIL